MVEDVVQQQEFIRSCHLDEKMEIAVGMAVVVKVSNCHNFCLTFTRSHLIVVSH
jgi:hypothetical protein